MVSFFITPMYGKESPTFFVHFFTFEYLGLYKTWLDTIFFTSFIILNFKVCPMQTLTLGEKRN